MKNNRTFESFEQFLRNIFSRVSKGKKYASYRSYINSSIKHLGVLEQTFLNASLSQLKEWAKKLRLKLTINGQLSGSNKNLLSGYDAFIAFAEYKANLISY